MTAVLIALENAGARGSSSSSGKAGAEGPLSSSLSSGEAGQWGSPDTDRGAINTDDKAVDTDRRSRALVETMAQSTLEVPRLVARNTSMHVCLVVRAAHSGTRYPVSSNLGSVGTMTTYSNTPLA